MSILPFTCSKPSGETRCFAVFVLESPLTPCLPAEAASRTRAPYALRLRVYAMFTCRRLNDAAGRRFALCGFWLEEQTPEQFKDEG